MLIAALAAMLAAICLGLWLSALYLIREEPPRTIPIAGLVHGVSGLAAVVLLFLTLRGPAALRGPPRGLHTGAGGFGWAAFGLMAAALAGGVTILTFHLRRKGAPTLLIAMHAMLGIAGGVMLSAWWASPASYGQ